MQNRFGRFDTTSFQEIMLSPGVFRRETASGFYPWGNVDSPRKRAAEGLCGWWHGNSFPTPQSAQSHSQMRSIPRCSKAVFMFLFLITFTIRQQSIIYPHKFSTDPISASWRVDFGITKMEAALFLVGKGEPPSLSSYFNFTFTCDLSIQRRREI